MTDDNIAVRELLGKSADAALLRERIGFAGERLIELEVQAVTGAGYGERFTIEPPPGGVRDPPIWT